MREPVLTRIAAPAQPPVTINEAKAHLRVDGNHEDLLIGQLIEAACSHLDGPRGVLGRCLVAQTWLMEIDGWRTPIALPVEPVSGVSIEYDDENGAPQTLASNQYRLIQPFGRRPEIVPQTGVPWPRLSAQSLYPLRVTMTAGAAAGEVHQDIRAAILLMVGGLYQHRESASKDDLKPNFAVDALLARHRLHF
jgi:uncharacterized phiE125 gp8 family phage protein